MLKKQIVYISDQTHEEKFLEEYILEEYILENNIASARDVGSCPRLLTELIRCEQDALEQNATLCTDDDDDEDGDDDEEEEEDVHLGGSARGAEDLELVASLQRQPLLLLQEYNHHHY